MLPLVLAAVGGYLVYDSLKAKKFADGGTIDNDYKNNKLLKYIETKSLDKNINGFEFDKENKMGGFLWRNKKMPEVKIYATPFYNSPNGIDYEEVVNSILVKAQDKKYKLTGDLEKDAKTYFDFVESVTKKAKFDIVADEEIMDSDGQTDKELYDALKDMGYNFGKYGTSKFDEDGFSEMAVNLGYRWDEKKKVWHNKNMMADGGMTKTKPTSDAEMKETMRQLLTRNKNSHSRAKGRIELYSDGSFKDWNSFFTEYEKRFGKQDADIVKKAKANYDSAVLVKMADGGMMAKGGKTKKKGDVGKSGTQYGYTLKEYEEMGEKMGLFVSPKDWWKSREGKKYEDSFGRTQTIGRYSQDERQEMDSYGYRIAIGMDLGSDKIPASARKYVKDNNFEK
jgi:hypothetical protein